ncbi:MAG TPA: type IV secretion system protein [Streptosporangiaceae bacterium]|nr:type IV secretion system protein [Streptosporangiaceae bacterium]
MARVTLAARRAASVLIVIAAVSSIPATTVVASTASTSTTASTVADASTTTRAIATTSTRASAPGTAPQGAICDGLSIVGLGGLCQAGSSVVSSLNDLCSPGPPAPEPAGSGIDAMIRPPSTAVGPGAPSKLTLYQSYGMAGQSWAPYNLKCSDMTSMIGNSVSNAVFDAAKAIDRITITTYQSAAGEGLLGWLKQRVDQLITQIGNAVYFPYLAPIVLLGVIWLAWQGLIRRRATRTIEGTIWMVVACAAAIWLIGRPADFTGIGQKVSDGISQVLNAAFSRLPVSGGTSCVTVGKGDPQSTGESYAYTGGNEVVTQNADELWAVLVCKPWIAGEFGTMSTTPDNASNPVDQYGRALLWSQAYAVNEQPTAQLATQKQDVYQGIASQLQQDPAVYPLFQGKQWATRLEIAFSALFAAMVAGALVLLIAITLIVLKLGFLLLLVAGPFFLIIGTHPGFGRVIAIRWFEMLVGVLMKQVAVALTLSVLLYCYALVMAVSDDALPWVFKIMMIALLTVAVFIYRKPFQHLFTSVGYDMVGARERAEAYREQSRDGFRGQTARTASSTIPGYSAYRAGRWARQHPDQADQSVFLAQSIVRAAGAAGTAATGGAGVAVAAGAAGAAARRGGNGPQEGHGPQDIFPPDDGGPDHGGSSRGGTRPGGPARRPDLRGGDGNGRSEPPPLDLQRQPRTGPPRWQPGPYPPRRGASAPPQVPAGSNGGAVTPQRRQAPAPARQAAAQPRPAPAQPRPASAPAGPAPAPPPLPPRRTPDRDAGQRKTPSRSWVRPIKRDR